VEFRLRGESARLRLTYYQDLFRRRIELPARESLIILNSIPFNSDREKIARWFIAHRGKLFRQPTQIKICGAFHLFAIPLIVTQHGCYLQNGTDQERGSC
jgi:hypothetical protein